MIVSLGRTPESLESIFAGISPAAIHEAINYALGTVRVVVTPSGDPWRVSQLMFSRMVDLALQKLAQLDPASAGTISRAEMARYIIERGYISSAPPPVRVQEALPTPVILVTPVVPPMPTVIVTPVTYTPPIRTVVIHPIPKPITEPITEPFITTTYPVVVEPPVAAEADRNTALWVAGGLVAGLILASMGKGRGGRYARR